MTATTPSRRTRAVAAALAGAAALSVSGGALAASASAAPKPAGGLDPLGLVTSLLGSVLNGVLPTVTSLPATLVQTVSGLPLSTDTVTSLPATLLHTVSGLPVPTDTVSQLLGNTDVVSTVLSTVGSPLDLVTGLLSPGGLLNGIHIGIG